MQRLKKLMHCLASGFVLYGLGWLPALAQSGLNAMDQHFMKEAVQGGLAEVELGNLAVQKASSGEVKSFGQRMVQDHTKATDQLKQIASTKGVNLPSQPNNMQMAEKKRLEKLSGTQFDQAYMNDMLNDHQKDVADFQKESRSGKDADLKNFAVQTLPTLQDHLKQAQSVAAGANRGSMQKPSPAIARR